MYDIIIFDKLNRKEILNSDMLEFDLKINICPNPQKILKTEFCIYDNKDDRVLCNLECKIDKNNIVVYFTQCIINKIKNEEYDFEFRIHERNIITTVSRGTILIVEKENKK